MLVDTSVWIAHERRPQPDLVRLVEVGRAATVAEVVSELRLGCGVRPLELSDQVASLPTLPMPDLDSIGGRMDQLAVRCAGVSLSDVRIIATALDSGVLLYSFDSGMTRVAGRLGIQYSAS